MLWMALCKNFLQLIYYTGTHSQVRDETYTAFENIYPVLTEFRKAQQWYVKYVYKLFLYRHLIGLYFLIQICVFVEQMPTHWSYLYGVVSVHNEEAFGTTMTWLSVSLLCCANVLELNQHLKFCLCCTPCGRVIRANRLFNQHSNVSMKTYRRHLWVFFPLFEDCCCCLKMWYCRFNLLIKLLLDISVSDIEKCVLATFGWLIIFI